MGGNRVYNSSNCREQARPLFLQAWRLAMDKGQDLLAVDAAHMQAIRLLRTGDLLAQGDSICPMVTALSSLRDRHAYFAGCAAAYDGLEKAATSGRGQ